MHKILFICHGNICRSPMAEFVMKDLVQQAGRENDFIIDSAAVSNEEEGNGIYPPARRKMQEHRIPFDDHRAHKVTVSEFDAYDIVVIMDQSNWRILSRIVGSDRMDKVHLMMSYAGKSRDVADPWYSGDFERAYQDILAGCKGLLASLV
ncbi:MAG: low molecular weight phosphotyrosine protein phosphatase [Proteobacteria bacterium]|nr:low molecular weight phosphotyrosine protein phosphatase [Pseudomonadota bacterium]